MTATPTITRTPSPTVPPEPIITFFGLARADDTVVPPNGFIGDVPVYDRPSYGFSLVVEGRPGGSNSPIGTNTFNWSANDPTTLPYLLIQASRPLGNGSPAVCDDIPPGFGGVPAMDPPDFSLTQAVADVVNDFSCRFKDGSGAPSGRGNNNACTSFADGGYRFVVPPGSPGASTIQFCGSIGLPLAFPPGETVITVRIRDLAGNRSAPAQLIIRVSQ